MSRLLHLSLGKTTAVCTLLGMALVLYANGQQMFSPGPLSERNRSGRQLGAVATHAQTGGNCSACHVAPWSAESMTSRCLDCHTNVRAEIEGRRSLHGRMAELEQCRTCHTEHHGAQAHLTSFTSFDHDWTPFPLTGKHRFVDCKSCHPGQAYKGTSHTCASCHLEPEFHKGQFGTNCASCHTTSSWNEAVFRHSFPITHGGGGKGRTCATCHPQTNDMASYTCYNCHRHDPANTAKKHRKLGIVDVSKCAACHPTGRRQKMGMQKAGLDEAPGEVGCAVCQAPFERDFFPAAPALVERRNSSAPMLELLGLFELMQSQPGVVNPRFRQTRTGEVTARTLNGIQPDFWSVKVRR